MADRPVGVPFRVEWVTVDEPDHQDDTNERRDRVPGFTPTRVQAQDKGAATFDREEGTWVGAGGSSAAGQKVYFDCTEGGSNNLGQIWEYDPGRETITLIFQSPSAAVLANPDNITIVRQTQDVLICEDSPGEQFIRGVTRDGEIYDVARRPRTTPSSAARASTRTGRRCTSTSRASGWARASHRRERRSAVP